MFFIVSVESYIVEKTSCVKCYRERLNKSLSLIQKLRNQTQYVIYIHRSHYFQIREWSDHLFLSESSQGEVEDNFAFDQRESEANLHKATSSHESTFNMSPDIFCVVKISMK